jgi:hypothetical protein
MWALRNRPSDLVLIQTASDLEEVRQMADACLVSVALSARRHERQTHGELLVAWVRFASAVVEIDPLHMPSLYVRRHADMQVGIRFHDFTQDSPDAVLGLLSDFHAVFFPIR